MDTEIRQGIKALLVSGGTTGLPLEQLETLIARLQEERASLCPKTKKVVINNCFGGFSLSHLAIKRYAELAGFKLITVGRPGGASRAGLGTDRILSDEESSGSLPYGAHYYQGSYDPAKENDNYFSDRSIARDDPHLVKVVEELGADADGMCAKLKVIEVPGDASWEVSEYDGNEHVAEKHRTWY